ncbi:uncharacterized protein LOC115084301 [Rhinatrema bivittatum]|uniref:uncharacterized protein LOC115084301 n=1 Tax=Rhinatrema bivittatum TaxID=194408 RepID=UPI00112D3706|nr:uncharacterized protein LOC115084301 [Rhinatrema bivittatum]
MEWWQRLDILYEQQRTNMSTAMQPGNGGELSYLFAGKIKFSASRNLATKWSITSQQSHSAPDSDPWKRMPPDFSVRLYRSFKLPKQSMKEGKEKRESMQRTGIRFLEPGKELCKIQECHFPSVVKKGEPERFVTRFQHVGPYEAMLMFVKNGKYPNAIYTDPKPHDFRQYENDIPEFVTSCAKDPLNLKLKSQQLSTVHRLPSLADKMHTGTGSFITYKPLELKWDPRLILPKSSYPLKSASYTRHRRRRGAYSAFMDRVEEKLTRSWQENYIRKPGTLSLLASADGRHERPTALQGKRSRESREFLKRKRQFKITHASDVYKGGRRWRKKMMKV